MLLNHLLGRFHDRGILKKYERIFAITKSRTRDWNLLSRVFDAGFLLRGYDPHDLSSLLTRTTTSRVSVDGDLKCSLIFLWRSSNVRFLETWRSWRWPDLPRVDRAYRALSLNFPIVARNDRSYPSIDRCRRSSKRDSFSRGSYVSSRERNE